MITLDMSKFSQARANMVDSQIEPSGVVSPEVLNVFETVPREAFLPDALQDVAYMDEDLHLGAGRYLMEPVVHARMLEALEPKETDVVLDIGCATGYSSAVLAPLVTTVIALEEDESYLAHAEKHWKKQDVSNVVAIKSLLAKGHPQHAPYDLIFINGAVSEISDHIVEQLAPEGRLVAVLKKPGEVMGQATLVRTDADRKASSVPLFDAASPYVPGFEPKAKFEF